jgi:hypothetical protein
MNATVVPIAALDYLTLWPAGSAAPVVSTLNAYDGSVTSNMAIVGDANGSIDAYAYNQTQLILDLSGYFALAPGASLPSVVFIGDDAISQWATNSTAFQQNPNWINKGIAGQTSAQVLARFQTDVIDLHPSVVNIDVGMNDVQVPGWEGECGNASIPAADTCANIASMATMAHAAGIKTIVGTIPTDVTGSVVTLTEGYGELFNRGLRQGVGEGEFVANVPDTIMVDYMPSYTPGPPLVITGYDVATPLAETAIALLNGATLESGYLGTPNSVNTIAVGGTIQFTAYGVYSDGVTRAVSNNIYYEGPCSWTSNDNAVMSINTTSNIDLGLATAREAGQAYISATCGGVEFSPWIMTVQ